jgi:hypothetical protein
VIAIARDDEGTPDEPGSQALADDYGRPVDLASVAIVMWFRDWSNRRIAEALGVKASTVSRWLDKAQREGRLDALPHEFGLRVDCRCIADPIRPGERLVCVNCCESGYDHDARMHAEALPVDRKAYRPTALKGGSGDAPADESAGREVAAEAVEDNRLGARAGRRSHAKGRRR